MKTSDISVMLLDHMGSDLTVVNAARVSMDKYHQKFEDNDEGLINYLATHGHWSPFAHCMMQIKVKAPLFVARQLQKHQIGFAWNEVSRRYVDSEPEFYVPEMRKRAENVKQGSLDEVVEKMKLHNPLGGGTIDADAKKIYVAGCETAMHLYDSMLDSGIAPEIARSVLPQSMMTEWWWTGSLYAFARVCNLRLDSHAQKETRMAAEQIHEYMKDLFPVSTKALVKA